MSLSSALGLKEKRYSQQDKVRFLLGSNGPKTLMHNVLSKNPTPMLFRQPFHKSNMSNQQYMATKPKLMNRLRDSDGDGVPNWLDCRPFNFKRQGDFFSHKTPENKNLPEGYRQYGGPYGNEYPWERKRRLTRLTQAKPLRVYHGTDAKSAESIRKEGPKISVGFETQPNAFFTSADKLSAGSYSNTKGDRPVIMTFNLKDNKDFRPRKSTLKDYNSPEMREVTDVSKLKLIKIENDPMERLKARALIKEERSRFGKDIFGRPYSYNGETPENAQAAQAYRGLFSRARGGRKVGTKPLLLESSYNKQPWVNRDLPKIQMYHGTATADVPSIMKKGLLSSAEVKKINYPDVSGKTPFVWSTQRPALAHKFSAERDENIPKGAERFRVPSTVLSFVLDKPGERGKIMYPVTKGISGGHQMTWINVPPKDIRIVPQKEVIKNIPRSERQFFHVDDKDMTNRAVQQFTSVPMAPSKNTRIISFPEKTSPLPNYPVKSAVQRIKEL